MSSRAKKKSKSTPPEPGAEVSKRGEGWFEIGVAAVVIFGVTAGGALEAFGSWKVSVACGLAAALLVVVLGWRGVRLF